MSKFKPLPKSAPKREITQAGDRSILSVILRTITTSLDRYGVAPRVVTINAEDAHMLAKELYDGRMTGLIESRRQIEAKIRDGRLTLFATKTPIRVQEQRVH